MRRLWAERPVHGRNGIVSFVGGRTPLRIAWLLLTGVVLAACSESFASSSPQLRLVVAANCPPTVGNFQDVHNTGAGLGVMVPPDPTDSLICRYGPVDRGVTPVVSMGTLYRQTRLGPSDAAKLAAALRQIRHGWQTTGKCAADTGAVTVMAFSFATRTDVDVWWHVGGCGRLDNGHVGAAIGGNPTWDNFGALVETLSPSRP